MNYAKPVLYGGLSAIFLYPLIEILSFNGSAFAKTFFSSTGFITMALYAISVLCFVGVSLEFAKKKEAEAKNVA